MRTALAGLAFSACLVAMAAGAGESPGWSSMEDLRWHYRPLVVFVPGESHPLLAKQRQRLLGHVEALADRDMTVIEVIGEAVIVDGEAASSLKASALRQRYRVATDEAKVLLIGKDGGVKLRQADAIGSDILFDTIDAMPMRRREMREQAQDTE